MVEQKDAPKIVLDLWAYSAPNSGMDDTTVPDRAADLIVALLGALEDLLGRDCPNRQYVLGHPAAEKARAAISLARGEGA